MILALRIILILIFLSAILLQVVLRSVPVKELRRRARSQKDKKAASVYKLAVFGRSSELFLYLVVVLSISPLVITAANYAWWLAMLAVLAIVLLTSMQRPIKSVDSWLVSFAAWLAPLVAVPISLLQPVLRRPARWLIRPAGDSTGMYEKEDLLEFLKAQGRQIDNRISADDLKIVAGALSFSDKTVSSVMTPRRRVKWVVASDPIGPMVMDELHKTGQIRFPVVKQAVKAGTPEVVGSLYLKDLLEHLEDKGHVRDIMLPGANYINESQTLRGALDGFLQSGRHLLIVVNNFEEIAGALTLEELLTQILGGKSAEDFDRYNDIHSVASQESEETDDKQAETGVE